MEKKQPEMETAASASSKSKSTDDCPILLLPPDILAKIIVKIPVAQWDALGSMDTFRAATLIAWRQLRRINVERDLCFEPENVELILRNLVERSPFLTSLDGIGRRAVGEEMWSAANVVHLLSQFEHLQSITLGSPYDYNGERQLESVVDFLESTRSRSTLKELRLFDINQRRGDVATILDQFASSFANGREIRLPLKLETFSFSSHHLCIRLDTIDATRLSDVRLGKTAIEPDQLTSLIERASNLYRIDLSFLSCFHNCNNRRLQANKNLLMALGSHENLTTAKFTCSGANNVCKCTNFQSEFIQMLRSMGRRGKLTKLATTRFYMHTDIININEICAAICNYIPYLQSITAPTGRDINQESIRNIVSLVDLEEIRFDNRSSTATANIIETIAQLQRLKRLALNDIDFFAKNSLVRLADVTTLTDLRVRNAHVIGADVFTKWSETFGPNLQSLMLSEIAENNARDEEGLVRLLEKATRLRVLILEGRITDRSLMAIAKSCPDLEIFGVRSMWNEITVDHLQGIVDCCPKLKRLGGIGHVIRNQLQLPKYRKISDVDMLFWRYDFDDDE